MCMYVSYVLHHTVAMFVSCNFFFDRSNDHSVSFELPTEIRMLPVLLFAE